VWRPGDCATCKKWSPLDGVHIVAIGNPELHV